MEPKEFVSTGSTVRGAGIVFKLPRAKLKVVCPNCGYKDVFDVVNLEAYRKAINKIVKARIEKEVARRMKLLSEDEIL